MLISKITATDEFLRDIPPCVVALGNFDGVHIGHTALLKQAVSIAKARGIISAVFTFAKHPESILAQRNTQDIITHEEKLHIFEKLGIERVYLADFENVQNLSPKDFTNEILKKRLNAVVAVCGFNFKFGQYGKGTPDDLTELMNGEAVVIPPVTESGQTVSSTLIREMIENGNMNFAEKLLGRPFYIDFPVLHGKELGRSIGVPTINQSFPAGHIIPKRGVYACKVKIENDEYLAVSNIGSHPTVDKASQVNCETHILGFTGWLYGQKIKVSFYKKLRDEKKFESVDKLITQIRHDIIQTKDYFDTEKDK